MNLPTLTPSEYADAYKYWQQQSNPEQANEIASILDQHTIRQRAAVARARAIVEHHDTPESQAHRRAVLANVVAEQAMHRGALTEATRTGRAS